MAENKKIILEIEVRDKNVEALNQELQKTQDNFREVGEAGEKSANRYSGAIKKSNPIVEKLDQATGGLLNTILDLGDATNKAGLSFKGLRTALIATGIGAIVVSVGLLVAYWDEIRDALVGVNKQLEKQLEISQKLQDYTQTQIDGVEKQIELSTLQGEALEQLQEQRIKLLEKLREEQRAEIRILEIKAERLKATGLELKLHERLQRTILNSVQAGLGDRVIAEQKLEIARQYKDLQDQINKGKNDELDTSIKLFQLNNPTGEEDQDRKIEKAIGFSPKAGREGVDKRKALLEEQLQQDTEYTRKAQELAGGRTAAEREEARKRILLEEMVQAAKVRAVSDGLGAIMGFMDQNSKAYKGFAIAQALINTYESANAAYKSAAASPITTLFPAYPIVQAGIAVTKGLAQVAAIKSTKVSSMGNVSGGGGGASGGGSIPAPSFNVVGNTGVNQLANVVGEQFNKPVKAYITTGDVNTAQQLENDTVSNASLG